MFINCKACGAYKPKQTPQIPLIRTETLQGILLFLINSQIIVNN